MNGNRSPSVLKWYFSPYLTTLITAPMFLILLGAGTLFGIRTLFIYWHLFWEFGPVVIVPGVPFLGFSVGPCFWSLANIPGIWYKPWNGFIRVLAIAGVFVGVLLLASLIDGVQTYIAARVLGLL